MAVINFVQLLSFKSLQILIILSLNCVTLTSSADDIIDTKSPIVIDASEDSSQDLNADSYFGYSLTFMKGLFGSSSSGSHPPPSSAIKFVDDSVYGTLLIGAPNEKRLANNSGIIWKCAFSSEAQVSCSVWSQVSNKNPPVGSPRDEACRRNDVARQVFYHEKETEQWIGASLSASRSKVYVCAPRWKRNGFYYAGCVNESAMVGACYSASSENEIDLETPLLHNPDQYYYPSRDHRGQRINEYWSLYAEYGMSSHVTWSEDQIVSAPSARKWKGSFLESKQNGRSKFWHNFNGEFPDVEDHDLLGYSVTSGRIWDKNGPSYYIAAGTPRGKSLLGVVTVSRSFSYLPFTTFRGDQIGSYFGFSLATADLNGDGLDELLIGAPLQTDFRSSSTFNTGCVYVIDLSVERDSQKRICPESITGASGTRASRGARFGSAILNLGDINFDSKEDFAVGAPYDDDGVGTVYIYYGGHSLDSPVHKIRGQQLGIQNLRGFGHQLHGKNSDIDGNTTPDLTIGAFESRHVVILRTRPVAKVSLGNISFHNGDIVGYGPPIQKFLPNQQNLIVRVCVVFRFSIDQAYLPKDRHLGIWLKYDVDSRYKRFVFDDDEPSEKLDSLSRTEPTCLSRRLKTNESANIQENTNAILFRVTAWYNETETSETQSVRQARIILTPSRRQSIRQDNSYQEAFNSFDPYLPAPIPRTDSEWYRLAISKDNCEIDGNPDCDPKLGLLMEVSYLSGTSQPTPYHTEQKVHSPSLIVGQVESIILNMTVSNVGETAYNPTIKTTITISDDLKWGNLKFDLRKVSRKGEREDCGRPSIKMYKNVVVVRMLCSKPLQEGEKMNPVFQLGNLRQLKVTDELIGKISLKVEAYPDGQESTEKVVKAVEIPLEGNVKIEIDEGESTTGQSQVDPTSNFVDLHQTYVIKNLGFSSTDLNKVKAEIFVPTHVNHKNRLVQVIGVANPRTVHMLCETENSTKFFDPVEAMGQNEASNSSLQEGSSRFARNAGSSQVAKGTKATVPSLTVVPEKVSVSTLSDDLTSFTGCDKKVTRDASTCQKIICYTDLPSKGFREVKLQMFVFRKTVEEIANSESVKGVRIESVISVSYHQKNVQRTGSTERKFYAETPAIIQNSIPGWVFLVAGGGGSILLLLITFGLFKCGFFRRKTKEQLQQLKRQTQMIDMNVSMNEIAGNEQQTDDD